MLLNKKILCTELSKYRLHIKENTGIFTERIKGQNPSKVAQAVNNIINYLCICNTI